MRNLSMARSGEDELVSCDFAPSPGLSDTVLSTFARPIVAWSVTESIRRFLNPREGENGPRDLHFILYSPVKS